jgi:uncharacterized protein
MERDDMKSRRTIDIIVLLATILLAAGSLSLIGSLYVDSSTEVFIPQDSEVFSTNRIIEEEFGTLDAIIVGITVRYGSILETEPLQKIVELTKVFESIDGVQRVTSLANSDHISGGEQGMEVVSLLTGTDAASITALQSRLNSWHQVYQGTLISENSRLATVIIQPETNLIATDIERILDTIRSVVASQNDPNLSFSLVGLPIVKSEINRSLVADIVVLAPIVALLILIVLFLSFKRLAGVLIPLTSLIISASLIVGIMAIFHITFTMATMLVPVLLLIVGSAYGIHVMSHFMETISKYSTFIEPEEVVSIIHNVITHNRIPVIMAGATTAAGFIAQFASPLGPFKTFGLLSAIGVVLSQISSLLIIPILLRLTYRHGIDPTRLNVRRKSEKKGNMNRIFLLLEKTATKGFIPLSIFSIILLLATIIAVPSIDVGTNMLDFFNPNSQLVKDTTVFSDRMNGSGMLTVMVDGKVPSSVLDPEFLHNLERFNMHMEELDAVGKVQTIIPYIKKINQTMNQNTIPYAAKIMEEPDFDFFGTGGFGFDSDPGSSLDDAESIIQLSNEEQNSSQFVSFEAIAKAYGEIGPTGKLDEFVHHVLASENYNGEAFHEIPTEAAKYGLQTEEDLQNLISQYLVLYSGNLNMFINDSLEPTKTLITLQLSDVSTMALRNISLEISKFWNRYLPHGWTYEVGGGEAISLTLTDLVTRSQIISLIGALLIVWILVSFMFQSPVAGLVSLIPVAFALMGIFSCMALFGIHLDIITSLLAALAIGIGVDYAIHFMSACKRLSCETADHGLATVYRTTGRAIIINAASVALGFSGLIFSRFIPIQQMGILFTVSMVFSGVSSLTVLPMVLNRFKPSFLGIETTTTRRASK